MSKNKDDIRSDPDSLTFYYMDTFLCNQYFLDNEECMHKYHNTSSLRLRYKRKLHK